MAIKTLKIGDSEDVWIWDDAETPFAIQTDADISAPNVGSQSQEISNLQQAVNVLEQVVINLSGRIDTLEDDLANGVSGTFEDANGLVITVVNGRVTSIV